MNNEELWKSALGEIELSISKANFITWFKNTYIISNSQRKVVIGVPNGFAKEWLENKYNSYIIKALRNLQEDILEISCVITSDTEAKRQVDSVVSLSADGPLPAQKMPQIRQNPTINPRYTFENFVIGGSNELARAACYAVSQSLGTVYNPLFIYGGVGLGKTHLLQSIGNEIIKSDPAKKIIYTTSEKFTSEFVNSIEAGRINEFKDRYRQVDLMIIDDVQFLSGKEKTQEEFFHLFNTLYQNNKQIVLSSDRPPRSIATIEERLRSRFEGGMIADVGRPELETRIAILKNKAEEKGFSIEEPVLNYVASNVTHNIRELEGALNKLIAHCQLQDIEPNLETAEAALSELILSAKKPITHKQIVEFVGEYFNINPEDIISQGRKSKVVKPRQIAMYLIREELSASYPSIGEYFGGRDHTTAIHAYEKVKTELKNNNSLLEDIKRIKTQIEQL